MSTPEAELEATLAQIATHTSTEIARVWLKERHAAAKLCEIYFDIAAAALGENEVRRQFAQRFEQFLLVRAGAAPQGEP